MLSIVVAASENDVIGDKGDIPWHLGSDLRRFKQLTLGHKVIMGRKTYDAIVRRLGKPLPDRENFVLTRGGELKGVQTIEISDLTRLHNVDEEVFVIGGSQVYALARPLCARIYLTRVHARVEGDTFFPPPPEDEWCLVGSPEHHPAGPKDQHPFSYLLFERL